MELDAKTSALKLYKIRSFGKSQSSDEVNSMIRLDCTVLLLFVYSNEH